MDRELELHAMGGAVVEQYRWDVTSAHPMTKFITDKGKQPGQCFANYA